jgi:hypothetical protein
LDDTEGTPELPARNDRADIPVKAAATAAPEVVDRKDRRFKLMTDSRMRCFLGFQRWISVDGQGVYPQAIQQNKDEPVTSWEQNQNSALD